MSDTNRTQRNEPKVDLVPVRWWQVIGFLRLFFKLLQGYDPMTDHILSHPWAPSSLLEYAYLLYQFFRSRACFVVVSGERAGIVWTIRRAELVFVFALGLLRRFQQHGIGMQTVVAIEEYARCHQCTALATGMAVSNRAVHMLVMAAGGHSLGMANTTLTLSTFPGASAPQIRVVPVRKTEARQAWRRWRLYEVEQVAGREGVDVAANLLSSVSIPRGRYLTLYQDNQEIGFALAHERAGELEIEMFPSAAFWPSPQTAQIIADLSAYLKSPIRYLTLTRTHADALADCASFGFRRGREQERHFAFKRLNPA